jgi:hypothetical protein
MDGISCAPIAESSVAKFILLFEAFVYIFCDANNSNSNETYLTLQPAISTGERK